MTPEDARKLRVMAAAAVPLDDSDWGSEEQIAAENAFFTECAKHGLDVVGLYETAKMNTEEMVDDAMLRLFGKVVT